MSANKIKWVLILAATVALLYPAFYNGYPLVFSDSGTYIDSGFQNKVPDDRPVFYGLFIRHASLASTLWFPLIVQSFIVALLLYAMVELLIGNEPYRPYIYSLAMLLLTVNSALPYFASMTLPDIFTPVAILLACLLLFHKKGKGPGFLFLCLAYVFFSLTHLSNLISLSIFAFFLCVAALLPSGKIQVKRSALILVAILSWSMWILLPTVNSLFGFGFRTNNFSHVFLMGKMIDNGLLKEYLDHEPEAKSYRIYGYKDSLPSNSPDFLWDLSGVLYKTGGLEGNKEEFNAILRGIVCSKTYLPRYIGLSLQETFTQLKCNNFGEEVVPYREGSAPFGQVSWRFKRDMPAYRESRQYRHAEFIDFEKKSTHQNVLIVISLLIILVYLLKHKLTGITSWVCLFVFLFILCNAFATATFSAVVSRYHSRVTWIIFFLAIVIVSELFLNLFFKPRESHA